MLTWTRSLAGTVAANEKKHAQDGFNGALDTAKLMLYTDTITPSEDTVIADLTEPAYTGYAKVSATWGTAYHLAEGGFALPSQLAEFKPSGGTPGDVVRGFGICDSGATTLLALMNFDQPIPISSVDDVVLFAAYVGFGGPNTGGVIQPE